MCGISGFIPFKKSASEAAAIIGRMNERLGHRGPDNSSIWKDEHGCLGHTRLSIIDLSAQSNQPFTSSDNRYIIVYNGELYNYRELKLELQRVAHGHDQQPYFFRTHSDTEVVLAAFLRWGKDCLHRFNGMFAFAIYDRTEQTLWAARDPLGVKPFYYHFGDEGFLFSSEIRAIIHSGLRKFTVNRESLPEYLQYQTVHAPATIVKGIHMLLPGHYLEIKNQKAAVTRYYDINSVKVNNENNYDTVKQRVYELLAASVQRRLVADVPFGAFLSGGIDSSAVVALMSQVSTEKVNTFNISFEESEFSESHYAKIIARKYNTRHHEIRLTPADFLQQLPEALSALDHPSGDGPNTYVVSRATRNAGITMALSGIGGDELFAGYDIFTRMTQLRKRAWLNAVPRLFRRTAAIAIASKKSIASQKTAELLGEKSISLNTAYPYSRSLFTHRQLGMLIPTGSAYERVLAVLKEIPQSEDFLLSAVSLAEIQTYLQNVLLRDTDQMSMAVALEVREPFLDKDLVQYVLSLPDKHKYPFTPKKLLVDSLGDLLPSEIVNRPKMGFTLPWKTWLRSELREFSEKHIKQFEQRGLTTANAVNDLWKRFLNQDPLVPWSRVWHIIVLNHWLNQQGLDT